MRSADEQRTTAALEALRDEFNAKVQAAEAAAQQARDTADAIRDALLYGTGKTLVNAVAAILRDARLVIEDLDERFGDTISADLLATHGTHNTLVEVKSSNSAAGEDLAAKMAKHLATWPNIAPQDPVSRGVLVVNHQLRFPPEARGEQVYSRKEFTSTLAFEVIASATLLGWWLQRDWAAIQLAFGNPATADGGPVGKPRAANPATPAAARSLRERWSRLKRGQQR